MVDTVQEVMDIPEESVEPPPKYGSGINQEFLTGMGKVKDQVVMLLDVDKIFTADEKEILENVQK